MSVFKVNGESQKELIELAINEIRENRGEIKIVKEKIWEGAGKIAANGEAISYLKWGIGTLVTIMVATIGWVIIT